MLSSRLIHLIETHWDEITDRVVRQIHRDADLYEIGKMSESDLRNRARFILENLGARLTTPTQEIAQRQEAMGRRAFEDGIPLHEVVHALHLIKDKAIEFVREEACGETTLDFYTEGEFEFTFGRLFDKLVYYVVRGYERAMRDTAIKVASAVFEPGRHSHSRS